MNWNEPPSFENMSEWTRPDWEEYVRYLQTMGRTLSPELQSLMDAAEGPAMPAPGPEPSTSEEKLVWQPGELRDDF